MPELAPSARRTVDVVPERAPSARSDSSPGIHVTDIGAPVTGANEKKSHSREAPSWKRHYALIFFMMMCFFCLSIVLGSLLFTTSNDLALKEALTRNANENTVQLLRDKWKDVKPADAVAILEQPDIEVTNQKDKEGQLQKLRKLDEEVKAAFAARGGRAWDDGDS